MNELMLKISELLEVSVEAATELYPVLRDQYIFYQASKMLLIIVVAQMLFYFVLIIFRGLTSFIEPDYPLKELREYKIQITLAVVFFIVTQILYWLTFWYSKDIQLITGLLN